MTMTLEKLEQRKFVFLDAQELKGTSKKTDQPYEMYIISFADPLTYENHQLNFKKGLQLDWIKKGQEVNLVLELVTGFGSRNSAVQVIDVQLVK